MVFGIKGAQMNDQSATHVGSRTKRLEARVPAGLKSIFARAAALRGQTLTDFVLTTVTEAAQRVIREQEVLHLSEQDQIAFARDLLNPPKPFQKLRTSARRYRRQVKR